MRITSLGEYKSIPEYVSGKLKKYDEMGRSFPAFFELMFSERENIFFEKSNGYDIEYTTYGEAYDRIKHCAGGLAGITSGLEKNSVIGLYMENSVDWIVAFWSILISGFRPLLLNSRISGDVLCTVMDECGAKVLISDTKELKGYKTIQFNDIPVDNVIKDGCSFGSEILVMSSGTTNVPKVCAYSEDEFYYQICDSRLILTRCSQIKKHYKGKLKLLTFLPFYHVFGLVAVYIWFAFYSRTFVLLNDFSAQTIINTIRRHEVTHIFAVPLFWNEVYKQAVKTIKSRGDSDWKRFLKGMSIARKICDIPLIGPFIMRRMFSEVRDNLFGESIKFMITGGSEIATEVLSFFNFIGYRLSNGYGASEIGITSVELSSKQSLLNSGSVGTPLPSVEYSIGDDGVLLVNGRSSAKYIIENGQTIPRSEWYKTGDLARCVNGHYLIDGRVDDIVIGENGENLNPCLIEPVLNSSASYQTCLISAREGGITIPTLLVYAGNHITASKYNAVRDDISKKLQQNMLLTQIQRIVFINDPLMLESEIKLNRARLSREYAGKKLNEIDISKLEALSDIDDETAVYLKEMLALEFETTPDEISPDADFFLDGGSSLGYFAMISKIQEDLGIRFPASQDKMPTTLRAIHEYIKKEQNNVD